MNLVLLNKPFQVLTRFVTDDGRRTLRDYLHLPGFHPAGRLDYDSEGLLLLTDDGPLQARLSHPRWKLPKTYFVQVEGMPSRTQLDKLRRGIVLGDGPTQPAAVERVESPPWLWPRSPPIRERASIPTAWLRIVIREGRNRQVRRMTAAVGHPTLRLIRWSVGPWTIEKLPPGQTRNATPQELAHFLADPATPARGPRRR